MTTTHLSGTIGTVNNELSLVEDFIPGPTNRSYWVVEDRLAAGAYPGEKGRTDFERVPNIITELLGAGINRFVNLTEDEPGGGDEHLNRYDRDVEDAAVIARHPIVDVSIPTDEEMADTLDAIDGYLTEGRSVYVHCWGGQGRTGTVIGCWMVRHGLVAPDEAVDVLKRLRRGDLGAGHRPSPHTYQQIDFVEAWKVGK